MKMKVIDRILLGACAFLSALALIALLICVISSGAAAGLMNLAFGSRIILSILLAALIAGSVYLIMMAFRPEGSAPSSSASVQESSEGSVRVSVRAMETLARRAIEQTDGVLDSKLRIINHEDSVRVEIDITIGIETHVPVVTALLQRNVKGIIEEFSGIAVREVVVLVTEIRNNAPAALPAPKDEAAQQVVIVPEQVEREAETAEAEAGEVFEEAGEKSVEETFAAESAEEDFAEEISEPEAAEEAFEDEISEEEAEQDEACEIASDETAGETGPVSEDEINEDQSPEETGEEADRKE